MSAAVTAVTYNNINTFDLCSTFQASEAFQVDRGENITSLVEVKRRQGENHFPPRTITKRKQYKE